MLRASLILVPVLLLGCPKKNDTKTPAAPAPVQAKGVIESRSGSTVTGEVRFTAQADGKVAVDVKIKGATPGDHGLHLHEKGDCSAPDATSAGGHFNPAGANHGAPGSAAHHAGDFGNLTVGADGTGSLSLVVDGITVDDGPSGVVGRALIFHEKTDDLATQPTGNAGARQGCAVIAK